MPSDESVSSDAQESEEVVVESSVGPMNGYYHKPEKGTWMGPEKMGRDAAEELGYGPCSTCFPEAHNE